MEISILDCSRCVYIDSVVDTSECPNSLCADKTSTPEQYSIVAYVCRNIWGVILSTLFFIPFGL